MAKYSFLDLAVEVLKSSKAPLTPEEIWTSATQSGLAKKLSTVGKTPWRSVGARIYVDIRDNNKTQFIKTGTKPSRFYLRDLVGGMSASNLERLSAKAEIKVTEKYKERDLHQLLCHFAFFYMGGVYTKTIFHERSSKKSFGEWLHPDMVGFYFPIKDWESEILNLSMASGSSIVTLYSFELKQQLSFQNLRESFFQAVSNSTWANESYLVAARISEDAEFLSELKRLSSSFGVGIISLDVEDPGASKILFQPTHKNEVDWETANKLAAENPDFRQFVSDLKIDLESKKIHPSEYDAVIKDAEEITKNIYKS